MDYVIRDLASRTDHDQCVALQRATWGEHFLELVPPALLWVTQKVGGLCLGAFDSSASLIGFVYGLTGVKDGEPVHWSHMLAVRSDSRDRGIGRSLKARQGECLWASGIRRVFWTFDPLVSRNAHLNLTRLGVRPVEYVRDLYGHDPMSTTDDVIGSDRLVVEWDLNRREEEPKRRDDMGGSERSTLLWETAAPPDRVDLPGRDRLAVPVPPDIHRLKRERRDHARRWREATRRAFEHYLGQGYHIAGFTRGADGGGVYTLIRTQSVAR